MAASSGVSDLLALATIRRIFLELGYVLRPEASGTLVGPLEMWMRQPHAKLRGRTPMQALAGADGEEQLRACIVELLNATGPTGDNRQEQSASSEHAIRPGT